MCRRALFATLLGLALASATNAELVGWWKFDEASGDTAFDSSGNGNDGTITGTGQWEPDGMRGGALGFDGSSGNYLLIPNSGDLTLINQGDFTITMWFKQNVVSGIANLLQQTDVGGTGRTLLLADEATGVRTFLGGTSTVSGVIEEPEMWYHVAMVVTEEGATDTIHFYINGEATGTPAAVGSEDCAGDYLIGTDKGLAGRWIDGLVDDFRLYNHALSDVEVLAAMEGSAGGYPYASAPNPADGVLLEATWANIGWRAGDSAVSHDVYMGDNFDDVNGGVADSFQGNQAGTSLVVGFPGFPLPGGLVPGTTYYWRIDEVNETEPNSPWTGDVWSFIVPPKKAYSPSPGDGLKFVDSAVTLSWTAGFGTKLNYVYFGDNSDDVSNAEGGLAQAGTLYVPGAIEMDKTYYWRVDEFDGIQTHKGDVWSFSTVPEVAVTDTNLTLWWTLEEGAGMTAVDWSGHGNHGAIVGDAQWADGYQGTALTFTGGAHVEVAGYDGITGTAPRTCCAWIKTSTAGNYNIMSWGQNVAGQKWRMRINDTGSLRLEVNGGYNYGVTNIGDGLWHHVAVTFEDDGLPDVLDTLLYVDGQLDATSASLDEPIDTASGPVRIGQSAWNNAAIAGEIDDARIYDKVLTAEEIQQVMLGDTKLAGNPEPQSAATVDIRDTTSLSWSAGDTAASHDVYFGTDRDAVELQGNQAGTSLSLAGLIEFGGGNYYWRVDEIEADGTVVAGTTWTFTVPDYLIVDDFEAYDVGNNEIWWFWKDGLGYPARDGVSAYAGNGTGSAVGDETTGSYTEETIVHGGSKAMPLWYANNGLGSKYSEVELTLPVGKRDWTAQGIGELSLWFQGEATNAPEPLYVAIANTAVVYHGDPDAAQAGSWTKWVIPLQAFADQGVNLANVDRIAIGLGTRGNATTPGTAGKMYFDDIRLLKPAEETQP